MVPIISGQTPKPKVLEFRLSKVGFPIRKSADQSFFAAPHGLSQRSTSFVASQRQGIHRTPLRHLIALIINVHTLGRMYAAHLSGTEIPDAHRSEERRVGKECRTRRVP